jgi:hypothetical protein
MANKNRRTFLQNVAAVSLFALSEAKAQGNSQATGRPPIQFDFATDLDKDDIYKFLDNTATTKWDAPPIVITNYTQSTAANPKPVGSIDKYPDTAAPPLQGAPIRLWWAVQKRCRVFEGAGKGQLVGTPKVVIPRSWQVTIQVFAVLFIYNDNTVVTPTIKAKIENAFNAFQYPNPQHEGPMEYLQRILSGDPTIKADYFSVVNTFSITKVSGSLKAQDDVDLAARNLYGGQTQGTVWTSPNSHEQLNGPNGFFAKRNIRLVCPEQAEFLGRVPPPEQDPHKVELKQGQNEKDVVQQIAQNDAQGQCSELTENDWPILTLAVWPEFKVDWRDFSFDIGCGIRIVLTLPVLEIQISGVDLWVYTKYPNSWSNVFSTIETCAFDAALSGAVVGVVMWDPVAGLAAFTADFGECITNHLLQTIECMIPGLGLVTKVVTPWHDVI